MADASLLTAASVLFDAVYVPGGVASVAALSNERDAIEFVTEAYRHSKPFIATGEGTSLLHACPGVIDTDDTGNGSGRRGKEDGAAESVIVSSELASLPSYRLFWKQWRALGPGATRGRVRSQDSAATNRAGGAVLSEKGLGQHPAR